MAKSNVDIIINATDKASAKIGKVEKSFGTLSQKAENASKVASSGLFAVGAAMGLLSVAGGKQNAVLETSEARWTTLLKSHDKAIEQMKWLKDFARSSPFDYKGLDEASTSMLGMGIELKNIKKWLPVLGDMAGTLGGGTETIKGVSIALGQMNAKGKVSAEEMNQLAERGVNAWGALADGMGLSVGEVRKLSEEGQILASDAIPMIMDGMEKTFGGGMQNYMKSTVGQAQEAQEAFQQLAGQLTKGVYTWFGSTVLPLINDAMQKLSDIFSGGLLNGFKKLWDSSTKAKIILVTLAGLITALLITAFIALAPVVASAIAAFAPFLAIGMAVAGLAIIIMRYWKPIKKWFMDTFGGLFSAFSDFFQGIWTLIQPILQEVVSYISSKLSELKAFWSENWGSIKQAVQNVWGFISGFISVALKVILAIFKFVFPAIKFVVMSVFEGIKGIIDGALNIIMGIVKIFTGLFTGNWSMLWDGVKSVLSGAVKLIWNIFMTFFAGKLLGIIGKFAGAVWKWIASMASKIGSSISKMAHGVSNFFRSMVAKVIGIIAGWVRSVISSINNFVMGIIRKIARLNTDMGLLFLKGWSAVKRFIKQGITGAINIVKGMFTTFKKSGKGLFDAFASGIKKGIGKAVSAVKGGMKKIREFLPFSPAKRGPLSDLDKSGEAFFPTWYNSALNMVRPMERALGGALGKANRSLEREHGSVALDAFGVSRSSTIRQVIEVRGTVEVAGEGGKEAVNFVASEVKDEVATFKDLRQALRKR